jgi:hypothetical protein
MIHSFPIHHFKEHILVKQQALVEDVEHPHLDRLSLLLLSRPIKEIDDTLIMEFFGVYWIVTAQGSLGFFSTIHEAVLFIGAGSATE